VPDDPMVVVIQGLPIATDQNRKSAVATGENIFDAPRRRSYVDCRGEPPRIRSTLSRLTNDLSFDHRTSAAFVSVP
jgi:hypothetical protein